MTIREKKIARLVSSGRFCLIHQFGCGFWKTGMGGIWPCQMS
jgi:hypothetical protein